MNPIDKLQVELKDTRAKLISHPLYQTLDSKEKLITFMEDHVFAVWDFMSLLKSLQNELTNTNVPWTPKGDPLSRRLINEIVLCEESDYNENNEPMSHFEMYVDAMKQIGCDTSSIEQFIQALQTTKDYKQALHQQHKTRLKLNQIYKILPIQLLVAQN